MINEAAGIAFLVILDCVLLAIGIYFALQGNEVTNVLSAVILILFLILAALIYRTANAEEKEEEQYESTAPS